MYSSRALSRGRDAAENWLHIQRVLQRPRISGPDGLHELRRCAQECVSRIYTALIRLTHAAIPFLCGTAVRDSYRVGVGRYYSILFLGNRRSGALIEIGD